VQCFDCCEYVTTCRRCFVGHHANLPFHWARVWNDELGYFVRTDRSAVLQQGTVLDYKVVSEAFDISGALSLGHGGRRCPHTSSYADDLSFIVNDVTGIHQTRIRFCWCNGPPDKLTQLLRARIFPATPTNPQSGFTFALLKQYEIQNMQGKICADDFFKSLRRLTDNARPNDVSVSGIQIHAKGTLN
jgi:hypothetical protein